MEKIVIWDDIKSPPINSNKYILWNSSSSSSNHISISKIVESNDKALRELYLSHIYELGILKISDKTVIDYLNLGNDLSFWWLTLLSQKCNFIKSENINDIIKFMAFEIWADKKNFSSIDLKTKNKDLYNCTKLWCKQNNIELLSSNVTFDIKKKPIFYIPMILIKSIINLFFYLMRRWNLKGHNLHLWKNSKGKTSFFSYLNINEFTDSKKTFESNFWGGLPDEYEISGKKTNWLHFLAGDYSTKSNKKIISLLDTFSENSNQVHLTIFSFLSFSLLKKALIKWIQVLRKSKELKKILKGHKSYYKKNYLLFFSEGDFYKSFYGSESLNSILYFYLIKKAIEDLPIQDSGIFLQENQPWEIILTHQWKTNNHKRIIACPHSTVRFWDFRYFFSKKTFDLDINCKLPVADCFAINGDNAFDAFVEIGYPESKLYKVEALRYMHLCNIKKTSRKKIISSKDNKKILILGDYSKISSINSINLLHKACKELENKIDFTLKPHPACTINENDIELKNINITNLLINEIIDKFDLVYSCNVTSAALDAYFYDIPIICNYDLSKLNLSPLKGLKNVMFISTPEEFRNLITQDIHIYSNKNFFNYFYLDRSLIGWKNLLQIDDIKSNITYKR
jgi:surface carbohydrate biosynthesis protein (TIGR04326 family)